MLKVALIAGALMISGVAVAQNSGHGHSHAAQNGGQIVKIGQYEAEAVAKLGELSLFLTDDKDNKVDSAAFSAKAVVLAAGNKRETVELITAGSNRLVGKFAFKVDGKFRVTVTLSKDGKSLGTGRYNLAYGK